jgi:hypothetical protein
MDLEIDGAPPFSTSSYQIRCHYPSATGAGVVPSAALSKTPPFQGEPGWTPRAAVTECRYR